MEHYSAIKTKQNKTQKTTIDAENNLDEFQGRYAELKKSVPKGYMHLNSIYIILLK